MSGTPNDPLRLQDLATEEATAAVSSREPTPGTSRDKGKSKKPSFRQQAAALSNTINDVLAEAVLVENDFPVDSEPETDGDSSSDSESENEDEPPRRKSIVIDPRRIIVEKAVQAGSRRLGDEQAEYVRRQLSIHQPDDVIQSVALEPAPVPINIQASPKLDDYFRDLLAEQSMGHARGTDTNLMKMQDNVRNILGPLTVVWAGLETENPNIAKMREAAEQSVILVGKAVMSYRHAPIQANR